MFVIFVRGARKKMPDILELVVFLNLRPLFTCAVGIQSVSQPHKSQFLSEWLCCEFCCESWKANWSLRIRICLSEGIQHCRFLVAVVECLAGFVCFHLFVFTEFGWFFSWGGTEASQNCLMDAVVIYEESWNSFAMIHGWVTITISASLTVLLHITKVAYCSWSFWCVSREFEGGPFWTRIYSTTFDLEEEGTTECQVMCGDV